MRTETVFRLFIGNSRQRGWQRLHTPAVRHANVAITLPSLTHHGTGERCPEESRLCSHCTNKESVNDLNFFPSPGVFYKLCVSCHSFTATHTPFVSTEKVTLIISITPPLLSSVHPRRSRPFTHLLKRHIRQAHLVTGVHSVLKTFKFCWGCEASGGHVDT